MKYQFAPFRLLLLFFLQVAFLCGFSQSGHPKFKRLTTNDGLSQGHVSAILKDNKGFMWFATDEGLNKYDGYRFTVYKTSADNKKTIISNYVYTMMEDHTGCLWVGTAAGLDRYNREKDVFDHYNLGARVNVKDVFQDSKNRIWVSTSTGLFLLKTTTGGYTIFRHNDQDPYSISNDFVYRVAEDKQNQLWVATQDGVNRFNPQTGRFNCYKNDPHNPASISSSLIKMVYKDSRNNIWAGTQGGGIALFNPGDGSFTNFRHNPADPQSISHDDILSFAEDNNGHLWVGTENGGINVFDYATKTFSCYQYDIKDNTSLSNNSVYSLYRDDIGNMWAGTWSGGVNFLPRYSDKFRHYRQEPGNDKGLGNNIILYIGGDSQGNIWLGTDGGGMDRFDRKTQAFTHYRHDPHNKNTPRSNYVLGIIELEPGLLAIGYHRGGFDLFDTKAGVFIHDVPENKESPAFSMLTVNAIAKDHQGRLWLGVWGGGVCMYDRHNKRFIRYQNNPGDSNTLDNNFIHAIYETKKGELFVSTETGLNKLDEKNNRFDHYRHNPNDAHSLSDNMVESMLDDKEGNTWMGSIKGLNLYDAKTQSFTMYSEKDGFSNNVIKGILEDDHGNLWISSNQGLTKFNLKARSCRNYSVSDGLQGSEFKARSCYRAPDGEMFFGGPNGFNTFYPDLLKDNDFVPPVYITDFQLFNKPVAVGDADSILSRQISETKEITLRYRQSVFTFGFSALNYILPEKNQYAYKLEGFDKNWIEAGDKRTATYTNLDPGAYTFMVSGSNNDGRWNRRGAAIKLIILPPFWLTWWFKAAIFIVVAGGAFTFYRVRINTVKKQKKKLQRQVREQTAQLVHLNREERKNRLEAEQARLESEEARKEADQANKAKSIFLATMSHEIRTPMNGVIGMASLLTETTLTAEQRGYTETISSCGESLLTVINDILDFSKIESGKMELEKKDFNLRSCIEELLEVFAGKAAHIGLDLMYEIDVKIPPQIIGDSLRLRQVLMNLVGNAIKFTHEGEIFVRVYLKTTEDDQLEIAFEVKDTGIGIPEDKLERLFKAFSQVDSSTTRKYGGTGLGLVICEKLIGLMDGQIWVTSEAGRGTTFHFTIKTMAGTTPIRTYVNSSMNGLNGKRILVVDDNATNRYILKNQLEQWKLLPVMASSGGEALDVLSKGAPFDLLLTDMQMPEMDGIEFSQSVQHRFPELPIILLSSIGDNRCKEHPSLFKSVLSKPIRQHILLQHIFNELCEPGELHHMAEKQNNKPKLTADFAKQYPLRLLAAEDNLINQQLILKILSMLGYEAEIADNGKMAFEMAGTGQFDLILMDVQMPEMDGLEATRAIRNNGHPQPFIIAMTANAMQGDQEECLRAGMDDYLSKPVRVEELMGKLKDYAGKIKAGTV